MDWLELARGVAVVLGAIVGFVAVAATLVVAAMHWLLTHPKD